MFVLIERSSRSLFTMQTTLASCETNKHSKAISAVTLHLYANGERTPDGNLNFTGMAVWRPDQPPLSDSPKYGTGEAMALP